MSKKKFISTGGIVYSTDPGFKPVAESRESEPGIQTSAQKLKIRLDTKNRSGKAVTLVEGFLGSGPVLDELGKKLKSYCGSGGSVKEGVIIIQGDHRDKVLRYLHQNGFTSAARI